VVFPEAGEDSFPAVAQSFALCEFYITRKQDSQLNTLCASFVPLDQADLNFVWFGIRKSHLRLVAAWVGAGFADSASTGVRSPAPFDREEQ
jgi:hypothetical protein